jgi:hypothetical protein
MRAEASSVNVVSKHPNLATFSVSTSDGQIDNYVTDMYLTYDEFY